MNRFLVGRKRLDEVMSNNATVNIVYHRGDSFVAIQCWAGRTVFRVTDQSKQNLIWGDRDYLIPVGLLVIDGVLTEPRENDWIEETFTEPTRQKKFRVSAPEGEQIWRYSGPQKTAFRVHTKEETLT